MNFRRLILDISFFLVLSVTCAERLLGLQVATVAWDPNPELDVIGYNVYYRDATATQTSVVQAGNLASVDVPGLVEGHTYLFYVTAVNSGLLESDPSDVVSYFVNSTPALTANPDQVAQVGVPFHLSAVATDPDPGQVLSFSLLAGAPVGATLNTVTGLFAWTPTPDYSWTTNLIGIQVSDNDPFPLSDTKTFSVVVQAPDSDGDGLPDWYERLVGLNPLDPGDALLDTDGDGVTNLQEFEAGTAPEDPFSSLRIVAVQAAGNDVSVQFTAVPGKRYRVEATDGSSASPLWNVIADNLSATNPLLTITDPGANSYPQQLYRAVVAPDLTVAISSLPAGFCTLQIRGHHGLSASALSFLGIGLTRQAVYLGRLDGVGAGTVSDAQANWLDGQFEGGNGPHYFEITSGPYAGLTADIITTHASSKSLVLSRDLSTLEVGMESYTIRPHWTLASVFGPGDEAGLGNGSNLTADEIVLLNPETGAYTSYFYKTIGLGGTGWRSMASVFADQSNATIGLGQGLLIRRKQADDLLVKLFGWVKAGRTLIEVLPGLNIVADAAPTALTLGTSGLYSGDATTGLASGSVTSSDKVLLFDGSSYQTFYYKTIGLGGQGWRSSANA